MTLAMHEKCMRSQEKHEMSRFTHSLEKKIAIFLFLSGTIYLRKRRSYKFNDFGNA